MSTPIATVVLPLYNDAASLPAVLTALEMQDTDAAFEVVVVDDGSQDDGPALAQAAGVTVLRQQNAGPAAARNTGAARARGEFILFLDADCVPPAGWVSAMLAPMQSGAFQAVMGTIRPANDGPIPRLVQSELEGRYRRMRQATDGVDFIAAPSCGVKREVFQSIGGFDESLRQAEDVELAYRLRAENSRIAFVESAPVAHHHQTGFAEFIGVKFRRAVGRMEVFGKFPSKQTSDSWTPVSLKAQFACAALVGLGVLLFLPAPAVGWFVALVGGVGLLGFGASDMRAAARAIGESASPLRRALISGGFVVARAFVILAAVLKVKLGAMANKRKGPNA